MYRPIACALALAGLFTLDPAALAAQDPDSLVERSATDLERGQELFEAHCARCHGLAGNGGEGLWSFYVGAATRTSPMSYAHAGKQYIVMSGGNGVFVFGLKD